MASSGEYRRYDLLLGCWTSRVVTGKVQLGVICIEMIPSMVGVDDITQGEGINSEKDWT